MTFFTKLPYKKMQHEHDDVYTFSFEKKEKFLLKPGQFALFILPKFARPRPFSLSSFPDEEYISFTVHVRPKSRFKKNLMNMKENEKILMVRPISNISLNRKFKEYVCLAQGIGITPFRSILLQARESPFPYKTILIHVSKGQHTFRKLTESAANTAYFPTNATDFQKIVSQQKKDNYFLISGSPNFTKGVQKNLLKQGMDRSQIKRDSFFVINFLVSDTHIVACCLNPALRSKKSKSV